MVSPTHVFLFKINDLYNIGYSDNLEKTKKQLNPAKLIASFTTTDKKVLDVLHSKFSNSRIPDSDYFKLSKDQLNECIIYFKNIGTLTFRKPIFSGFNLLITFLFFWILLTYLIVINIIDPIMGRFY